MVKVKLSRKQVTAVLATIYHELEALLDEIPTFKKITDDPERRKRVLEDLRSLLTKTLEYDLNDKTIFKLFEEVSK